jgi:ubiquitin carboxyl-terminal hydrolase 7
MAFNIPSPNEMLVDADEYDGDAEKDSVAIITPDNLDRESEQLQDLPLADDRRSCGH